MKPVDFEQRNAILAEHQPEYRPLPCYRDRDGAVLSCWRLTIKERLAVLLTGRVWHWQLTFDKPFQPVQIVVDDPWKKRQ